MCHGPAEIKVTEKQVCEPQISVGERSIEPAKAAQGSNVDAGLRLSTRIHIDGLSIQ